MRRAAFLLLLLTAPLAAAVFHLPHDGVFSVATGPLAGGGFEVIAVTNAPSRVMRSTDDGLTWNVIAGAGLEQGEPRKVVRFENAGAPLYLIGSDHGLWSYDSSTGAVVAATAGMGADTDIVDLTAPAAGSDGPAMAVTRQGSAYTLAPGANTWIKVFDFGQSSGPNVTKCAIAPHFDSTAPAGPARAMMLAFRGVVYSSVDGGGTWTLHPQFTTVATSTTEWFVTALAFTDDWQVSGVALIGRGRQDPVQSSNDPGEIWRSTDFGATYAKVYDHPTMIGRILAAPPGPNGARSIYVAANRFPNALSTTVIPGVLRSDDDGLTWSDFGNAQDFIQERGTDNSTRLPLNKRLARDLAISPTYLADGKVFLGRAEGMWVSRDQGFTWSPRRIRRSEEVRALAPTLDPNGALLVFAGSYGAAGTVHNLSNGTQFPLKKGAPVAYTRLAAVSPNFAGDGTVLFGGFDDLTAFYDPTQPAANPFNSLGWVEPRLRDTSTGRRVAGDPQTLAMSPHYDGRGLPGTDSSVYFGAWGGAIWRSLDGMVTADPIELDTNGTAMPFLADIVVAPTYDAATPAGRTDVYGGGRKDLYRLEDTVWRPIWRTPSPINSIALDPSFSRPGNARMFLSLNGPPHLVELIDDPTGPIVTPIADGLEDYLVTGVAVPPDFAVRPFLYAVTWGQGVFRRDMGTAGSNWEPVGIDWPQVRSGSGKVLYLSPTFDQDRVVLVGTDLGLAVGKDEPGFPWMLRAPSEDFRDDIDPGYLTWAPNDPRNPDPSRPYPWRDEFAGRWRDQFDIVDESVRVAITDGSELRTWGWARNVEVYGFQSAVSGAIRLTAYDYDTGTPIGSLTHDFNKSYARSKSVKLELGTLRKIEVRIEVMLDPNEVFAFDGIGLIQ